MHVWQKTNYAFLWQTSPQNFISLLVVAMDSGFLFCGQLCVEMVCQSTLLCKSKKVWGPLGYSLVSVSVKDDGNLRMTQMGHFSFQGVKGQHRRSLLA